MVFRVSGEANSEVPGLSVFEFEWEIPPVDEPLDNPYTAHETASVEPP